MREISIYGMALLSKTEGIARSVYISLSLDFSNNIVKELDKILYEFIQRKKPHYVKKEVIQGNTEQDGLEVLVTLIPYGTPSAAKFFWFSIMGDIQQKKACCIQHKYCISNKVKEVCFKILHRIYPANKTLERFNLNTD